MKFFHTNISAVFSNWFRVGMIVLLLGVGGVHAATFTSVKDGNWDVASTWGASNAPASTDIVIINHAVVSSTVRTRNSGINTTIGINGSLEINAQFNNQGTFNVNGIFKISAGTLVGIAPIYSAGSTLIYNTLGNFAVGIEWNAGQNNGVSAGVGIPNNVTIQGAGTILSLIGNRGLAGFLSVTNNATFNLNNFELFTKSTIAFTGTGAIAYSGIDAKIRFCANGTQTISSTTAQAFPAFWCDPPAGSSSIQLGSNMIIANPAGGNAVNFGSNANNQLQIGNNTLTLGSSSSSNGLIGIGGLLGGNSSKLRILSNGAFGSLLFIGTAGELFSLTEDVVGGTVSLSTDIKIYDELKLVRGEFNINGKLLELSNAKVTSSPDMFGNFPGYFTGSNLSNLKVTGTRSDVVTIPLNSNISFNNIEVKDNRTLGIYGNSMAQIRILTLHGTLNIDINATFDNGGENQIFNGSGSAGIYINGRFITKDAQGFAQPYSGSGGPAIPGIIPILGLNSTIEYARSEVEFNNGIQIVNNFAAGYRNLTLSGSDLKIPSGSFSPIGTISILEYATFDCTNNNIGNGFTNLTMAGNSRLKLGTFGLHPTMGGLYNLTQNSTIEFANNNSTVQTIDNKTYNNIDVSGSNVANSSGAITLKPNANFTITSTGRFRMIANSIIGTGEGQTFRMLNGSVFFCETNGGLYGPSAAIRNSIPNIDLQTGSTVNYSRVNTTGDQTITTTHPYQNLVLSGLGIKSPAIAAILNIQGNLTKTGTSTFDPNAGKVLLNGTNQSFDGLPFYDLELVNGTKTFNGGGKIANALNLTSNTNLAFANNAVFTIGSDVARTASVYPITGSSIISYGTNSSFQIERYLKAAKAWRLLATPVTGAIGTTIAQSWQEGPSPQISTGYGTRITGPIVSNGIDQYTQRGSMKWFSEATQNYVEIANTNVPIARNEGYYLFVRGDRGVDISGGPGATTLRIKGQLNIGDKVINVAANKFASVGNPYASRIDFRNIIVSSGLVSSFTTWDPTLPGSYGVGQFQTWSKNGSNYHLNGISSNPTRNFIESGEAFFVQANATAGNLTFVEAAKVTGSANISRPGESGRNTSLDPSMEIKLLGNDASGNELLTDGVAINFNAGYTNEIDENDVRKFNNSANNLALKKADYLLTVDRRPLLNSTDTIFLTLGNFMANRYAFIFDPAHLYTTGLQCELIDQFANSRTPVSLVDSNYISFEVTADPASKATDRFKLVFKTSTVFPLTFTSITAAAQDNNILTNWKVQNEKDIVQYELQRSADGRNFSAVNTQAARGNNATGSLSYSWLDTNPLQADNYYRVLSTGINGEKKYSDIVSVNMGKGNQPISVFPNPMREDKNLSISFVGKKAGVYLLSFVNAEGQVMYSEKITHNGTDQQYPVQVKASLTRGTYMVTVRGEDKSLFSTKLVY